LQKNLEKRGTGAFISALSADETSPALAAPRHAITTLFCIQTFWCENTNLWQV
jgi:hypothetical protein